MKLKIHHYICLVAALAILLPCRADAAWGFSSVKSFGATGNGSTDDTAAINAAIATGTGSTVVYFPPGTYKYVGPMTLTPNKSFRIYGDGPGVSTILFVGPNAGLTVTHTGIATLNVDGLTLMASTASCGTALNASFASVAGNVKFHSATIHNVQVIGTARDGTSGGYWTNGIRLYRGQNSVLDKIEVAGNKNLTQTGISLEAATSGENATGFELANIEVQWCNVGLSTNGWVEGLYMTGFEIVSCGRNGLPAIYLNGTAIGGTSAGTFQLVNGLVDSVGGGITMSNIILGKVSNVSFRHNGSEIADGTMLSVTNVMPMLVSECSFAGTTTNGPFENGIFLTNVTRAQISGNNFTNMHSQNAGSAIVVYSGSSVVRITDNLFSNVTSQYNDQAPLHDTYYFGNNP
jgi:polygalacturonase